MVGEPDLAAALSRHVATREGFPRVDWESLTAELAGPGGAVDAETWRQLGRCWLQRLVADFGRGATCRFAGDLVLVELPANERANRAGDQAGHCRDEILRHLPGIAVAREHPLPVLLFADYADYVSYHADFDPPESESAAMGGTFFSGGYPHLAAPIGEGLDATLAHELTHAHVGHLPLPLWLNEGMAVSMELLLTRQTSLPTTDDIAEHRARWRWDTIQRFWSGDGFRDVRLQRLSYQLAHILVQRLARDYTRLCRFANAADAADAGVAAFQAVYGRPLAGLPEPLLGHGRWVPRPERW